MKYGEESERKAKGQRNHGTMNGKGWGRVSYTGRETEEKKRGKLGKEKQIWISKIKFFNPPTTYLGKEKGRYLNPLWFGYDKSSFL